MSSYLRIICYNRYQAGGKALKRRGITVVEMMITLAIVAVLAVMVVPNLGGWIQHYRVKGAVREIVSQMELAKIKALKHNREYRLYVNTLDGVFRLERGNLPNMSSQWDEDGGTFKLPNHVSFEKVTFPKAPLGEDHERAVQFNPHGTAGSGRVVLTNARSEKYTITVTSATGRIDTQIGAEE